MILGSTRSAKDGVQSDVSYRLNSLSGDHMSYSLNSFKDYIIYGITIGAIKGDTRSLDYSSYRV